MVRPYLISHHSKSESANAKELQRDLLPELEVVGAVYLTHSAAASEHDDPIPAHEDLSRRQPRSLWPDCGPRLVRRSDPQRGRDDAVLAM